VIITIDGPAGSGKSAAALALARQLHLPHLDTGAMYRAVALDALQQGLLSDPDAMVKRVDSISISFDWSQDPAPIQLNGTDVSEPIRSPKITEITFLAADNPGIRTKLVRLQREIGVSAQIRGGLVTEGRDQGTIVFPDAACKFYLDAKPEIRAGRRVAQLAEKGMIVDAGEALAQLLQRDLRDSSRSVGPLAKSADAHVIDTTDMTLEQVIDEMGRIVRAVKGAGAQL